jgi:hypothetical protein
LNKILRKLILLSHTNIRNLNNRLKNDIMKEILQFCLLLLFFYSLWFILLDMINQSLLFSLKLAARLHFFLNFVDINDERFRQVKQKGMNLKIFHFWCVFFRRVNNIIVKNLPTDFNAVNPFSNRKYSILYLNFLL